MSSAACSAPLSPLTTTCTPTAPQYMLRGRWKLLRIRGGGAFTALTDEAAELAVSALAVAPLAHPHSPLIQSRLEN